MLWNVMRGDVLIRNVGTEEQRTNLLNQALVAKNLMPSKYNSNDGCWRSSFDYQGIDWLVDEIKGSLHNLVNFYLEQDPSYNQRFNPSINNIVFYKMIFKRFNFFNIFYKQFLIFIPYFY